MTNDYSNDSRWPQEVIDLINAGGVHPQTSVRLRHKKRKNGVSCSEDLSKDACMHVRMYPNGDVFYYCHRCCECGRIPADTFSSPKETLRLLEYMKEEKTKEKFITASNLPDDFYYLSSSQTPQKARDFLRKFSISPNDYHFYDIGWSHEYQRLIIPLYFYVKNIYGVIVHKELIGWTGRCIEIMPDADRRAKKRPKWFHKKLDPAIDRLFFMSPKLYKSYSNSPVVFVEDPLSAIRVGRAASHEVIAVLSNHIPYSFLTNYRKNYILIWLDYDMREKAINYVKRFNSLGFKAANICTVNDPKAYTDERIRTYVNEGVVNASRFKR